MWSPDFNESTFDVKALNLEMGVKMFTRKILERKIIAVNSLRKISNNNIGQWSTTFWISKKEKYTHSQNMKILW